jgi:hypothetical protein
MVELTTAKEARDLRERIYQLYLRGLTGREISRLVNIDESQVSRHLTTIRNENVAWFQKFKEPAQRLDAFFKEFADRLTAVYREAWVQYNAAVNPQPPAQPTSIQNRIGLLNTMLAALRDLRVHYRMIAPSIDEVYYRQQLEELKRAIYEKRQAEKVTPLVKD